MTDEKNVKREKDNSDVRQDSLTNAEQVDVETVLKGAELVKDKYELLYADIIEAQKEE